MKLGNSQKDNGRGTDTTYFCENLGPMFQQDTASLNISVEFTLFSHFLGVKKQSFYLKFVGFTQVLKIFEYIKNSYC